jgi:hypothetical protein
VRNGARELLFVVGSVLIPSVVKFRLVREVPDQRLVGIGTVVSEPSGSEYSLNLAKHWYYDCLLSHESCGPFTTALKGNKWLPTRLIHITETHVRLCHSIYLPDADVPYATLSHCWGKVAMFEMKSTNIAALKNALPLDQRPKTFLDAISVCR